MTTFVELCVHDGLKPSILLILAFIQEMLEAGPKSWMPHALPCTSCWCGVEQQLGLL
jgi:hypothetical protein